jgi:hypothetical protein
MNKKEQLLLYMGDRGAYLLVFNLFCFLIFIIYITHKNEINTYNLFIVLFIYFSSLIIFILNRIKKYHLIMKEITRHKLKYLKFVNIKKPDFSEEVFKNKHSLATLSDLNTGDTFLQSTKYGNFDGLDADHYFLYVCSLYDENILELMRPHWLPLYNETEKTKVMNALDKSQNARLHYGGEAKKA